MVYIPKLHRRASKILFFVAVALTLATGARGQYVALKTDIPGWATASFNLEPEVRLAPRHTLAVGLSYNPWTMNAKTNMKWRHILVQPEYRYWFCSAFNGHFLGIHAAYMHYNIGGLRNKLDIPFARHLNDYRYQGDLVSIGIGYGYHWIITNHFSIEAELGLGAAWTSADYYYCETCGEYIGHRQGWFFTPTKLSVSLIWLIR